MEYSNHTRELLRIWKYSFQIISELPTYNLGIANLESGPTVDLRNDPIRIWPDTIIWQVQFIIELL